MTPAEKYGRRYSAEEEALLIQLRSTVPPMPWGEIARLHFPDRNGHAIKTKVYSMDKRPPPCPTGRPKGCDNSANTPSDNNWEDKAAVATVTLGEAIEKWFERCNMPPARRRWLLAGPTVLPRRIAA